ncbi:hypothetical protein MTP99_012777 [Tenebrio molitor]|nr:hypothetical protein MTP99_012777 [Tenebrio molitor]
MWLMIRSTAFDPRLGLDPLEIPCSYQPSSTPQQFHTNTYYTTHYPFRLPLNTSKYSLRQKRRGLPRLVLVPPLYLF